MCYTASLTLQKVTFGSAACNALKISNVYSWMQVYLMQWLSRN